MSQPTPVYFIYKATNKINSKSYIGFTQNVKRRMREHLNSAKKGCPYVFHQAIRKHGWYEFEWEVICSGWNKLDMLEYVEPAIIKQHNTEYVNGCGYNMRKRVFGIGAYSNDRRRSRTPDERARISASVKKTMASPVVRQRLSESVKEFYRNGGKS